MLSSQAGTKHYLARLDCSPSSNNACNNSLDASFLPFQVEIVMGLEEEFGISVEEESAQGILTVQDAAELIEKLLEKKA